MTQREADSLPEGEYRAVVDATLEDGSLTYGEVRLDGSSPRTVLLTTTVCHPALANDNLSGIVVTAALARALAAQSLALQLPAPLEPGHARAALLAPPQPRSRERRRARPRDLVCRRPGARHLQAKPARRRRRPTAPRRSCSATPGARRRRLVAVRRRRAPVLRPGLRSPVRRVLALARGRVPRVPLVGRRPLASSRPRRSPTRIARSCRSSTSSSGQRPTSTRRPTASRSSGAAASTARSAAGSSHEAAYLWLLSLCDGSKSLVDIALRSGLPFEEVAEPQAGSPSKGSSSIRRRRRPVVRPRAVTAR